MTDGPGRSALAFAPATVGNVGCGFDVFGLALEGPGDRVRATLIDEAPGVTVAAIVQNGRSPFQVDVDRIPREPTLNSAAIAVDSLIRSHAPDASVELHIEKGLPLSAGLGGSAASAVAAVVAAEALLGLGLDRRVLLPHAAEGELRGSGSSGGDNLGPSLLGGWLLVRSTDPFDVIRLPVPDSLRIALIYPHGEVRTAHARSLLGTSVDLSDATRQWANTAATVAALHSGDLELLGRALTDHIAEPRRAALVPGFDRAKAAALDAGALACSLSGSGPSVFALCEGEATAKEVGEAAAGAFMEVSVPDVTSFVSGISGVGARVLVAGQV